MKIAKGLFVVAAFVLASSAAQAQYTFEYGGAPTPPPPPPPPASIRARSGCSSRACSQDRLTAAFLRPRERRAIIGYHYIDAAGGQHSRAAAAAASCPRSPARAASAACSGCDGSPGGTGAQARRRSGGKFAARRVADRREGRQGQDRAMRRQSLRLFGGFEVGQERRAGSDQYEARQGRQMERADSRPQYRLNL